MLPEATHSSYVHVKVFLLQIHLSLHIMNFSVDFYSFIHRLFEDAADKLNLMALAGFLYQLKKASQAQLFHSVTDTVDYSLAMPGRKKKQKNTDFFVSHTAVWLAKLALYYLLVLCNIFLRF